VIVNLAMSLIVMVAMIKADNVYVEPRQPDFTDPLVKHDFLTNIHLQDYPSLVGPEEHERERRRHRVFQNKST